ncbi:PA14 domain-containing protein [Chitinophaga niastensis]|uniref:PA14 domain-containing protein n=1 Tax=Chitinophaga niastensis TaxID=536980 RepID=A0A2P8HKG3_CHINA|nr:DUF5977 domain-containing protein [Chitinophaga niastensis]PSL46715.1 PA14 domain-containing protein [Chitinophaga niastensis]
MILALVARGRKIFASLMLAVIYLEVVIPTQLLGASLPVVGISYKRHISSNAIRPASMISETQPHMPVALPATGKAGKSLSVNDVAGSTSLKTSGGINHFQGQSDHLDLGGPTQPEMQAFHSAGNENMVDLFSGDFNYNIPLLDVGGYPVTIGYNSGINMDQEASWVGLGWNINPGTITRNLRGIPDDFNGKDFITKELTIKENKTVGVSAGGDIEIGGSPINLSLGGSLGIFKNSYKGWGFETSMNASINAGSKGTGSLTGGLSVTNNSQEGLTISPSLGYSFPSKDAQEKGGYSGSLSVGTSYNSRYGMKGLQLSGGLRQYAQKEKADKTGNKTGTGSVFGSDISFAYPGYTPTISIPYTNEMTTVTLKIGGVITILHPSFFASGYVTRQFIADADKRLSLPAFGYLNYQSAANNLSALLDYNREKEVPYRESPAVPNIAVPSYSYDIFSISGEGTGGSFRAYRNDIGYVYDHEVTTRDQSRRFSGDVGFGEIVHGGVDINYTRAFTRSALWANQNPLAAIVAFRKSDKAFEASYFRNPGEKTINASSFYDALGGDNVVTPRLYQDGFSSTITSTNRLTPYKGAVPQPDITLNSNNVVKPAREKRTQSISYLTAKEASEVGLSKYIENYSLNNYGTNNCKSEFVDEYYGNGDGLKATYYDYKDFNNVAFERVVPALDFYNNDDFNRNYQQGQKWLNDDFSAKYTGRLKVPQSGTYWFQFDTDDGFQFFMNDEIIYSDLSAHSVKSQWVKVNMEGGKLYNLRVDYYNAGRDAVLLMKWKSDALGPNPDYQLVPANKFFLTKNIDTFVVNNVLSREKRINSFRKADHISEIDVLNSDGRKYVYGIPVYNLQQKEATFSVDKQDGNNTEGLVKYVPGQDDGLHNNKGNDNYYSGEFMPAYAHSFLLTGILSPDYTDITGDGITDDDPGNAIRFNYTKTAGIANPFKWRTPYNDSATYNEGMKTDYRDDKGSYVSGAKELWYLNTIESKNMIAVFRLSPRKDLLQIDSNGIKSDGGAKRLDQIDLYTKADFLKYNTGATPVKTVHFDYTYELCTGVNGFQGNAAGTGKLTLKRIWFSYNGNDKNRRNAYVFNYNKLNPSYSARKYDRWGNYKDPLQNPGSTAANLITNSDYPYALQDSTVAAANVAAWTLDSIVMPSGGRLKINYESDDYAYVQNKRAMQMCKVAGFSKNAPSSLQDISGRMYGGLPAEDYMYVAINVPYQVHSNDEVYARYLEGISKIYFRLFVNMPSDKFGDGSEFVPCYARLDANGGYGYINNGNTIWVKLSGIDKRGNEGGSNSPLVKAAFQFLKLNLPSKAYPGSDVGDNPSMVDGVKMLLTQAENIANTLHSFEDNARPRGWAQNIDTSRSVARLNSPVFKKYGGGLRVKNILSYDHWNKMSGQRESVYGKEYNYTTTKIVNGDTLNISSGVASYEPALGGEENPWHMPVEYLEQVSLLAPVNLGYTEEPLGESFFPAPAVGYSKVRVRTINAKNTRSVNGFDETCFYTTKDFPTITERTTISGDTKKRFKNDLGNLLKINARHFLTISQGFKIELNDMNGKMRSQASYAETDPDHWITYTENFYKVDNQQAAIKHLDNRALTISAKGIIDTSLIGKDLELMLDMREQRSLTNGVNLNVNGDFFMAGILPFTFPSMIHLPQREENTFRSVAATKVINRHGILDSVVVIDKGSRVVTHNLLYDTETGDPVLTSIQNEFNDPVYNFNYPAAWIYEGMSGAYKNVGVVMDHIDIKEGRIINGLQGNANDYFFTGDELLVFSKRKVAGTECEPEIARWPAAYKVWVVNANMLKGSAPDIYFVNQDGSPLTGSDISLKITRSGRRNIAAGAGSVAMLRNPLVKNGNSYAFVLNDSSRIINASVTEFKEFWKVPDRKKAGVIIDTFRNEALSRTFTTYCGADGTGSSVVITVPAGTYKSVVSQAIVNEWASDYLDNNGQYLANQQGKCTYYNWELKAPFRKNDCGDSAIGSLVKYTIAAGTDSSNLSTADANSKAYNRLVAGGPGYANANGFCTWYNSAQTGIFIPNNCPTGARGLGVSYTVPAGKDSSVVSKAQADSLARIRLNIEGQAYANVQGICWYYSVLQSKTFTKNNCGQDGIASSVVYTVPAGADSSTVSQSAADNLALARLNLAGQAYANANGICTYYNVAQSGTFTRNNCTGGIGSTVTYTLPANTDSSNISIADANSKTMVKVNAGGQAYANANGTCKYYNVAQSGTFTRNNCTGGVGSTVTYTLPANTDSSAISVADANSKTLVKVNAGGQAYANANGICTYYNVAQSGTFTRNNCTGGVGSTVTYALPANTDSSNISIADANSKTLAKVNAGGQAYANANGICTYYNVVQSGTFTRNNCTGGIGSTVTYTLPANTDSSNISIADANSKTLAKVNVGGQAYANANGTCKYYNVAQSGTFTRNNCTGGVGSTVTYTLPANTDSSNISIADANSKTLAKVNAGGQAYANANGICIYYNTAQGGTFTRNNCTGGVGSTVTYTLPANTDSSNISIADANSKTLAKVNAGGQGYANANGICTYYNVAQSGTFTRNNCAGGVGSIVIYTLPANTDSSNISIADANSKTLVKVNAGGQAYANANGICTYYNTAQSGTFTRNNCTGGIGSTVTYTLPANTDSSNISIADANSKTMAKVNAGGQAYANVNGTCKYYNVAQSGTFTRNNCTGGVGSTVTYTLPANTDSSAISVADANSKTMAKVNAGGQAYANANGICTFYNVVKSQAFTRNNCAAGGTGSSVTYTVAAATYSSTISQADADAKATADITANGQAYANTNGTCTFYSVVKSQAFTRNNCAAGGTGSSVTYTVAAATYSSIVSQADADAKATADITANGQAYANTNGICTFYNVVKSQAFTRNNCAAGGTGSSITYTVAAATYSSIVSQADADAKATADITANGQAYANTNGTCTFYNIVKSQTFTRNNCAVGGTGSSVTYTVAAAAYNSTISQADADNKATADITANGQAYANTNGTCTFYNVVKSQAFTRNNCAASGTGSSVTYTVAAAKYSSTISQVDADTKATADITANGQAYANANGTCTFYNVVKSQAFTRNNCAAGGTGSSVTYTVAAAAYNSTISQADADSKATADITANGQANANTNGTCTFYNVVKSQAFTRNNCAAGGTGSSVTYTVAAATYSSTISQADADGKATADITANGQAYANANGTCTFYSVVKSQAFTRNNCAAGGTGSSVTYTVAAAKYSSTISQADADGKATADITANGQAYANANGTCTFYSVVKSQAFTRNNCAAGGTGSSVTYTVAAAAYNSTISQADADAKATADITANGQAYANTNGTCTFYNVVKSQAFTRNNCAAGGTGSSVTYTVAAAKYSSTISQADADAKATADITANGQAYANTNGTCTFYNVVKSQAFTRNNCAAGGTGSSVTYTVAAAKYSSTISQADADAKATADITANGQAYANTNGICTFYNVVKSQAFTRNNCAAGGTGSSVTYTVAAAKYSSTISQADADAKATADITANGQAYANTNGICTFYNAAKSQPFTKNNCAGGIGSTITYTVPAAKYSSIISQADADNKAQTDINSNGQAYANANGTCQAAYAKLSYPSYDYVTETNETENASYWRGDLVISFYSDAACTVPLSVTNLPIILNVTSKSESWDDASSGSYNSSTTPTTEAYTINGSSMLLKSSFNFTTNIDYRKWEGNMEVVPTEHYRLTYTFVIAPNSAFTVK